MLVAVGYKMRIYIYIYIYILIAILNTHFGNATMKKYYEQMDQAADREKELMALTEFSVKLLRKIAKSDVNVSAFLLKNRRNLTLNISYLFLNVAEE